MKTRTVTVSSFLPAGAAQIRELLRELATLQYIASPYAQFSPIEANASVTWSEGSQTRLNLRIFGLVPLGVHTVRIVRFRDEPCEVLSEEGNRTVPVWRHRITLEPYGRALTRYTDEVTLSAGALTFPVSVWAGAFYRHRQKRWRKLLNSTRQE